MRLLQGVGFAALTPILVTSIGDIYSGFEEATAQGLQFTGSGMAQMIFPLIAGFVVVFAWQYPFLLYGLSLPIAVVIYRWLDEPVDQTVIEGPNREIRDQIADLGVLLSHQRAVAMVFAPSLAVAGDLAEAGESGTQLSVLTMAFGFGTAVGPLVSGALFGYGFVVPFAVGAVLAIVALVLVLTQVEETLEGAISIETFLDRAE